MTDARASALAYSGSYRLKGIRGTVALSGSWPWPVARLLEVHDGDTVKLAIDQNCL